MINPNSSSPIDNNIKIMLESSTLSFNSIVEEAQLDSGYAVYLNIYHLSVINYAIQIFGFGFFHSTIEVNNIEYSFGATTENISGIFFNKFGEGSPNIQLKEKIYLGNTIYNDDAIKRMLCLSIPYWMGKSYDPFLKNCNHFTQFLAEKLLRTERVVDYPEYVNRITEYVIFFHGFYSPIQRIYQNILYTPNENANVIQETNERLDESIEKHIVNEHANITNGINNVNDICIDVNRSSISSPSRLNKRSFCDLKVNENENTNELFFNEVFRSNMFLNVTDINSKNEFIRKMKEADTLLLIKNKIKESFKLYQDLLKNVDSESMKTNNKYEKYIKGKSNFIYSFDNESPHFNDKNYLLKIKILHCLMYIFYLENLYSKQEIVSNAIIKYNKNDFYAIFSIAYCKFKQNKFPESSLLIQSGLKDCKEKTFTNYFNQFQKILDDLDFS